MRNRFELLLLFSARFIVGYPAAWLLAMATSLGLLVHAGTRNWKGDLAALHDLVPHAELIMIGFAVTVSAFALALLLLPL
jgi:hypothetical protein